MNLSPSERSAFGLPVWLTGGGDVLCLNAGFLVAFIVRFGTTAHQTNIEDFVVSAPVLSAVFVGLLAVFDLYRKIRLSRRATFVSLVRPLLLTAMFTSSFVLFAGVFAFPRSVMLLGFPLGGLFVLAWRICIAEVEKRIIGHERAMAIVSYPHLRSDDERETLRRIASLEESGVELVAVLDHTRRQEISSACEDSEIVVLSAAVPSESRAELTLDLLAAGKRILLIPTAGDVWLRGSRVTRYYSLEGLEIVGGGASRVTAAIKRLIDVVIATTAGLILLVPVVILAILVRIESRGSPIFRQERTGRYGQSFSIAKLRTMTQDAEEETGPTFATARDPRVTRLGHLLRRTRLDEIPQLWNVIRGDMSLIGPRPERPEFVAIFENEIPAYIRRLEVRPGVTGLAQVRAGYSASPEEKLRYDLQYINEMNLLSDAKIAVQTLATMLDFSASEGTIDLSEIPGNLTRLLQSGGSVGDDRTFESGHSAQTTGRTAPSTRSDVVRAKTGSAS